jgi:hypothetical protein
MYMSLEDSCTKGFKKWADAHEQEIKKDVRAGGGDGVVAADTDLDNGVMIHPSGRIVHGSRRGKS